MNAILDQLGLDNTFFVQLGIFAIVFLLLAQIYFKPFMRLFEARHQLTVKDREAAERFLAQAEEKLNEYQQRLVAERNIARKEFESALNEARKEEAQLLAHAREEAKRITQEAAESVNHQREQLKKQLEGDIETLARSISERLISRKV